MTNRDQEFIPEGHVIEEETVVEFKLPEVFTPKDIKCMLKHRISEAANQMFKHEFNVRNDNPQGRDHKNSKPQYNNKNQWQTTNGAVFDGNLLLRRNLEFLPLKKTAKLPTDFEISEK